jgi:hypothetical protein
MVGDIRNIIVIQSLFDNETKTGADLYNDTIRRKIDYLQPDVIKMTHKFFDVASKDEFVAILKDFQASAEFFEGGVLFHFEMHGLNDISGLIFSDRSSINWFELADLLREINIIINNNLFITMATCFGRYLYKGAVYNKKAPYSGYISASKVVTVDEIMDNFTVLFDVLILSGNLVYAYLTLDEKGSNFFYKDLEATNEENLKQIKNDPDIKQGILDIATKSINYDGDEAPNQELIDLIYESAANKAYEEWTKNFLF